MTYAVKEVYRSIQGEGFHAGAACVFLRFAGCNAWTGRETDRKRDSTKAICAAWCDTDFVGYSGKDGGRYPSAENLARVVERVWGDDDEHRMVVATGGEPSLQLDELLVTELLARGFRVHVETNGTRALPASCSWVTVSPKPPLPVVEQRYDEVKVVYGGVGDDVERWRSIAPLGYLVPLWTEAQEVRAAVTKRCAAYVQRHPSWRMGAQLHKFAGLP